MRSLTLSVSVLGILCCGGDVTEPLEEFPVAWMVTGCSPVDGPAVELYLGHAVSSEVSNPSGPHVRIAIDARAEAVRGNRYTSEDDPSSIFAAQHCIDRDQCTALASVTVEFDPAETATREYAGRLEITLPDGSKLQGTFVAELYALLILCG